MTVFDFLLVLFSYPVESSPISFSLSLDGFHGVGLGV
jgi:hypothetical protein